MTACIPTITLLNTRLTLTVPLVSYKHDIDKDSDFFGRGVMPDYKVKQNINDFVQGLIR